MCKSKTMFADEGPELNCASSVLQELDYKEFRMFAMACIDKQMEIEREKKKKLQKRKRDTHTVAKDGKSKFKDPEEENSDDELGMTSAAELDARIWGNDESSCHIL